MNLKRGVILILFLFTLVYYCSEQRNFNLSEPLKTKDTLELPQTVRPATGNLDF